MRNDEEFVKNAVLAAISPDPDRVEPGGNDPPDYTLHFGSLAVALEVTQLSDVYLDAEGHIGNRRTANEFLHRINDELIAEFSSLIPNDTCILIHYTGPVAKAKQYKLGVKNLVHSRLLGSGFGPEIEEFEIAGETIRVKQISNNYPERKKFFGFIDNKHSIVHIASEAQILLDGALKKKTDIMATVSFAGEKWLGFLNTYFLADAATYEKVLQTSHVQHCFARIFLVSIDGNLEELTKQ